MRCPVNWRRICRQGVSAFSISSKKECFSGFGIFKTKSVIFYQDVDVRTFRTTCREYCSSDSEKSEEAIIPLTEVERFVSECMISVKTPKDHAKALAQVLIAADYRGHFSHGLNRLDYYIADVSSGICDSSATPSILSQTAATAFVDGNNGLGPIVGNFSMQLAIDKCKSAGVGWVVAKGSNHYGIAGWYSLQAKTRNLIGISLTNTSPFLSPTRSKEAALGTNPLSVAAGGLGQDEFVLDMATTAVAVGKKDPSKSVLVAGDPETAHMKKIDTLGGIPYHLNQIEASKIMASKLRVKPMKPIPTFNISK